MLISRTLITSLGLGQAPWDSVGSIQFPSFFQLTHLKCGGRKREERERGCRSSSQPLTLPPSNRDWDQPNLGARTSIQATHMHSRDPISCHYLLLLRVCGSRSCRQELRSRTCSVLPPQSDGNMHVLTGVFRVRPNTCSPTMALDSVLAAVGTWLSQEPCSLLPL